jgi:hypothetical protein
MIGTPKRGDQFSAKLRTRSQCICLAICYSNIRWVGLLSVAQASNLQYSNRQAGSLRYLAWRSLRSRQAEAGCEEAPFPPVPPPTPNRYLQIRSRSPRGKTTPATSRGLGAGRVVDPARIDHLDTSQCAPVSAAMEGAPVRARRPGSPVCHRRAGMQVSKNPRLNLRAMFS